MLEAKDTGASVLQKKKSLQNFFSGVLLTKKKGHRKNFSGDLQKKVFKKTFRRSPNKNKKRSSKKIFRPIYKILIQKNSAALKPRTGQFSEDLRPRTYWRTPPLLYSVTWKLVNTKDYPVLSPCTTMRLRMQDLVVLTGICTYPF